MKRDIGRDPADVSLPGTVLVLIFCHRLWWGIHGEITLWVMLPNINRVRVILFDPVMNPAMASGGEKYRERSVRCGREVCHELLLRYRSVLVHLRRVCWVTSAWKFTVDFGCAAAHLYFILVRWYRKKFIGSGSNICRESLQHWCGVFRYFQWDFGEKYSRHRSKSCCIFSLRSGWFMAA